MRFDILTLFPNLFESYLSDSILKRALDQELIDVKFHNIRDYSSDKHHKVDDTPYGGGAGMVMACQPLFDCIKDVKKQNSGPVIFLTPQGERFTQNKANNLAANNKEIILLCGRYEGIDQRVRDQLIDQEISIGDYVLTGGELPAMILIDSIARQIPGVLGNEDSQGEDSFSEKFAGKKEYPHYTKPAEYEGHKVPDVLLSGNHAEIEKWREERLK
ncbi:tRNA (guanosine(37)-N1)-methyltransferase TrmD [Patescibacteria group bacterium]|nr:tRNA (guanosine(37)-N1)-methyltransferase TrmD [Patescibacteria group bacterium]